jgi:glutamate racemase
MPIGIFDSGLGGLTVLQALVKKLPEHTFVYFGDNANAPFGNADDADIWHHTTNGTHLLFNNGCDLVILACNTASAVALRALQREWLPRIAPQKRVLGVFVPTIESITGQHWRINTICPDSTESRDSSSSDICKIKKNIALFATPATVRSGAFQREARSRSPEITVTEQDCPGLVEALENDCPEQVHAIIKNSIRALEEKISPIPQTIILGCTHYPLAKDIFCKYLPDTCDIVEQPEIVANSLREYLKRHPEFQTSLTSHPHIEFFTSGDPLTVTRLANKFYHHPLVFRSPPSH